MLLTDKIWLIVGYGKSGQSLKLLLEDRNLATYVYDDRPLSLDSQVGDAGSFIAKHHRDLAIAVSPGIPPNHPVLRLAKHHSLPILSEIEIACSFFDGRIIAVTGTNGKSTCVAMISHILSSLDILNRLGGNFGEPCSGMLLNSRGEKVWVLELSSFQIHFSSHLAAELVVLTNIASDHLQWHGSLAAYTQDKAKLITIAPGCYVVLSEQAASNPMVDQLLTDKSRYAIASPSDIKEFSFVNRINAGLALRACSAFVGERIDDTYLAGFKFLEHRFEVFASINGYSVINDSKSTNIHSCINAIESIRGDAVLFVGGKSKGEDFSPIKRYQKNLSLIVVFGESRREIACSLTRHFHVIIFSTLEAALKEQREYLRNISGDILFSPGCPSQDEFVDYAARGDFFKQNFCLRQDALAYGIRSKEP